MQSTMKLVVAVGGLSLALTTGVGIASGQPDVGPIINSTCSYSQVMAALNAEEPATAAQVEANPVMVAGLQNLIASPPEGRRQIVADWQNSPAIQPYVPLISQVVDDLQQLLAGSNRHRHRRHQLAGLQELVQVSQCECLHGGTGLFRSARDVGQQHDVVHPQQSIRHLRLVNEHVQARAREPACGQRVHQRRFVDHAAPGDIDQIPVGAERVDDVTVDQVAGFGATGRCDDQHVDLAGQLERRCHVGIRRIGDLMAIVVADRAPERRKPLGDSVSDAPQPDDPHAGVADLTRQGIVAVDGPPPVAQIAVGCGELTEDVDHQPDGGVGHAVGEHIGGVADRDAPLAAASTSVC